MTNTNPVETRIASVLKDRNGIILITMKDCGNVDKYDVIDINLIIHHKAERKAALKLLDARADWNMSKPAKEIAKLEDSAEKTKARAVIVSSQIKVALFKFLWSLGKKNYPQRFFTDRDKAYSWLLTFKKEK